MTRTRHIIVIVLSVCAVAGLACASLPVVGETPAGSVAAPVATTTTASLPSAPVQAGAANPNEPVFVTGDIPFTSPFFLGSFQEPFILLEDEAGYVKRDREFEFPLADQQIGPVSQVSDKLARYTLSLPEVPQGTLVDVDHNGKTDQGVEVFAVAYWSNLWGGPFLERRDGTGWSNAYTSTLTDPTKDDAIVGGTLIVWAPDDHQQFPTSLGDDGILFTPDDPVGPIPAGYNIVDMSQKPFHIYKEAQPRINLNEGAGAVNDYSKMSRSDAFEALFKKISVEYPFTEEKKIDWNALHAKYAPRVAAANSAQDYYLAIRDFMFEIPDNHVGVVPTQDEFAQAVLAQYDGGYGLVVSELSDGRVIVSDLVDGGPAMTAGVQLDAEIVTWAGKPIKDAISAIQPRLISSYSTDHKRREAQDQLLTRAPDGTQVTLNYKNPGGSQQEASLTASTERDSLIKLLTAEGVFRAQSEGLSLPVEGKVLPSGIGYIRVNDFEQDQNLMAHLWDHYMSQLIDNQVPGLIIDLRKNGGGNGGMAIDFAGYFFDTELPLYRRARYNQADGKFEYDKIASRLRPGPLYYKGPLAVLVSAECVSACEGFAYALALNGRAIVVGHTPTAGAFGSVGAGQASLPDGISLQFPTDRPETEDGKLVIEGTGVVPDITVPVTIDSVSGKVDAVLDAAVAAIKKKIGS